MIAPDTIAFQNEFWRPARLPLKSPVAPRLTLSGAWGQHARPGGFPFAFFFETALSLAPDGTAEALLADLLTPIREVPGLESLARSSHVATTIDDRCVAERLIPHLLSQEVVSLFLPPIAAVLIPGAEGGITAGMGRREDAKIRVQAGWETHITSFGDLVNLSRTFDTDERRYKRDAAELRLDRRRSRLVVVHGQHRAMALVAIRRNWMNSWRQHGAFTHEALYKGVDLSSVTLTHLAKIELPVCVYVLADPRAETASGFCDVFEELLMDVAQLATLEGM